MSFFIKGKRKKDNKLPVKNKLKKNSELNGKHFKSNKAGSDEEISSDFEEDIELQNQYSYSSDEEKEETVQEKKLRLAKKYLDEIVKEEQLRLETNDVDKEVISSRLKDEELALAGKLKKQIGDTINGFEDPCVLRCKDHNRCITCLVISSDNKFLFSASDDFNIVKWSLKDKKKEGVIKRTSDKGHKKKILCLALSSDSKFLVSGGAEAKIQVWNPINLTHTHTFCGHKFDVSGLAFQKGSHQLFSCSSDKTVKIWNLDEMMYVETLYGHQSAIASIDALFRERAVTSGGRDNSLRIWKIVEESHLVLNGPRDTLDCVRLVDEEHMVSGGEDGFVSLWSSLKKKPLFSLADAHGPGLWIISVATCPYTDLFATGSYNGVIEVYKIEQNFKCFTKLLTIPQEGCINSLCFTSDGKTLIAAVGKEHRLGRWVTVKSARNSVVVIPLTVRSGQTS